MALSSSNSPAQPYRDGYVPPSGLQLTVGALPSYPLATESTQIPDNYALQIARDYLIDPLNYTPRLGARTAYSNLLLYSADPTNSAWTKSEVTTAASTSANPVDGQLGITTLFETTANAAHYIQQAITLAATPHLAYAIVRGIGRTHARLRLATSGLNYVDVRFTLYSGILPSVGTLGTGSGSARGIYLGDDWWLLVVTLNAGSSSSFLRLGCSDGTTTYIGDTTKGLDVYTLGVVPVSSTNISTTAPVTAIVPTLGTARSVSVPDVDTDDPFAFLCAESDPQRINSRRATLTRRYRRVPKNQIRYDAQAWQRPEVPGTDVVIGDATYRLFGTDYLFYRASAAQLYWEAYIRRTVALDAGVSNTPTGGTATLTFAGQTTGALNYNDSAATVKAALDALSTVAAVGGLTSVTGNYNDANGYLATFAARPQITIDITSLTGTSISKVESTLTSGAIQFAYTPAPSVVTGGTFTLTVFGATTGTIAYNADTATIVAALNALSIVSALGGAIVLSSFPNNTTTTGLVVYSGIGASGEITIQILVNLPALTGTSSITPAPSAVTVTRTNTTGEAQYLKYSASQSARVLTFGQLHGFTAGQPLYFKQGSTFYFRRTDWTLENITQISVNPAVAPWNDATAITEVGSFQRTYSPGPAIFRAQVVSEYYLPGYTMLPDGTTCDTAAEIPPGSPPLNDTLFLEAVLSGAESVVLTSGPIQSYLGPMLVRETTSLFIPA